VSQSETVAEASRYVEFLLKTDVEFADPRLMSMSRENTRENSQVNPKFSTDPRRPRAQALPADHVALRLGLALLALMSLGLAASHLLRAAVTL
jgi:hypothetical protein